jgi:hypothetical protein
MRASPSKLSCVLSFLAAISVAMSIALVPGNQALGDHGKVRPLIGCINCSGTCMTNLQCTYAQGGICGTTALADCRCNNPVRCASECMCDMVDLNTCNCVPKSGS